MNTSRIYATGYSDGCVHGIFVWAASWRTESRRLPRWARFFRKVWRRAEVIWSWRAVPLLMINGTDDRMVPYKGRLGASRRISFCCLQKKLLKEWAKINNWGTETGALRQFAPQRRRTALETHVDTYTDCSRRRDHCSLFHREGRPHLARRRGLLFPCASSARRTMTSTRAN